MLLLPQDPRSSSGCPALERQEEARAGRGGWAPKWMGGTPALVQLRCPQPPCPPHACTAPASTPRRGKLAGASCAGRLCGKPHAPHPPVAPLFSGWNWVADTLPFCTAATNSPPYSLVASTQSAFCRRGRKGMERAWRWAGKRARLVGHTAACSPALCCCNGGSSSLPQLLPCRARPTPTHPPTPLRDNPPQVWAWRGTSAQSTRGGRPLGRAALSGACGGGGGGQGRVARQRVQAHTHGGQHARLRGRQLS